MVEIGSALAIGMHSSCSLFKLEAEGTVRTQLIEFKLGGSREKSTLVETDSAFATIVCGSCSMFEPDANGTGETQFLKFKMGKCVETLTSPT